MPHKPSTQLQGITDLTVFADIKQGLVDGIFDSRSYAWRLQRVLTLLDAARHASREADALPSPFIDGVARLRGIHFFRFAVLPGGTQLFLNVTFDGGWETYMRLIWGPLGTLLDLIFCHCDGYPLAATSSYEDYIRWVRCHEVPSQFFYADSGGTVADLVYMNRLEAQQNAGGERFGADLRAVQLALDADRPPAPTLDAVATAIRTLKGIYGLVPFFGAPARSDGSVLLRFAQDSLPDLRQWVAQGLFDPGQRFDVLRAGFERELVWLMAQRWTRPAKRDRTKPLDAREVQAGIFQPVKAPPGRYTRGALVLARVTDQTLARKWLASASKADASCLISDGGTVDLPADGQVVCTVAITYPGLQALGARETDLAQLPGEFIEGMEARAGILGDLRINHPQQWRRPRANWGSANTRAPIDLPLVHLVMQLRTCECDGEQSDDRSSLLPRLEQWLTDNLKPEAGVEVMAVEPAWSRPPSDREPAARDNFGYVDGVSQPGLTAAARNLFWDDVVKTGELLLGWVTDRGDGPLAGVEPQPSWLDLGTFLVVRKIRQYIDRFDGIVDKAADALLAAGSESSRDKARELVRAKLLGRGSDGSPLITQRGMGANDFNYRHDTDGTQCPFASHVRRANPRAAVAGVPPPRIMRRGMAYGRPPPDKPNPLGGDQDDRGVFFMAYNASIAEQFEVIQRWMTGGNSSGVSSSHPDPFVGVPRIGEPAIFRFAHGDKVARVDLGDQPICRLEWGIYAFVPSMSLLQGLGEQVDSGKFAPGAASSNAQSGLQPAQGGQPAPPQPPAKDDPEMQEMARRKQVKEGFEDENLRRSSWENVRSNGGVQKIGRSVMVGGFDLAVKVLKDKGETYSAGGYGIQMKNTVGHSPFGQDEAGEGHERPFVEGIKKAIEEAVKEEDAYATAYEYTAARLESLLAKSKAMGFPGATVDTIELGTDLIAQLCEAWFGVVYEEEATERGGLVEQGEPVRCPGHFLSVARYVFSAYPNKTVEALAEKHGAALKPQVANWVKAVEKGRSAPVLHKVLEAMQEVFDEGVITYDDRNSIVANVILGLPATLLGSWGKVLRTWSGDRDRSLWRLQYELAQVTDKPAGYSDASSKLRKALIATMAADPVADGIWRTVRQDGELGNAVRVAEGEVVWLGLGSALYGRLADAQATEDLIFGGSRDRESKQYAPHACPGRGLAIGAMLGALAALLQAGELAATPSPTTLMLKPLPP